MTMNWILLNIPLGVVMVAIAAGLPAWVIWRFPEGDDSTTAQRVASRSREHSALTTRSTFQHAATAEISGRRTSRVFE